MFKTQLLLSEALALHALPLAVALSLLVGCGVPAAPKPITPATPAGDSAANSQSDDGSASGKSAATAKPIAPAGASLSDNACISKTNCPAADLDFLYSGGVSSDGHLMGTIGTDVAWSFAGLDHKSMATGANTSSRKTVVFVLNAPTAAIVTPPTNAAALANVLKINWTSTSAASGSFTIVVRDYERCKFNAPDALQCDAQTVLPDFDKAIGPVPFAVTQDGTGTAVVASAVSGTAPTAPTASTPAAVLPQPTASATTTPSATTTTTTAAPTTKNCTLLGTLLSFGTCLL